MFKHSSLGPLEIRLLDFTDAETSGLQLIKVSVDEEPEFDALSYSWGNENCLHPLRLANDSIAVFSALFEALNEFLRRGYTGRLWVDGICIDQNNEAEKSLQIPLMRHIYSQAQKVIVWLGPAAAEEDVTKIFRLLPTINEAFLKLKGPVTAISDELLANVGLPALDSTTWEVVVEIYSKPWFRRLWVLQEAVLANDLQFWLGSETQDSQFLPTFANAQAQHCLSTVVDEQRHKQPGWIVDSARKALGGLVAINGFQDIRKSHEPLEIPFPLESVFGESSGRDVTRQVDRIYGILGLLSSETSEAVPIDPTATPQDVFFWLAKSMLRSGDLFYLLELASSRPPGLGIPSWCPNWESPSSQFKFPGKYEAGFRGGPDMSKMQVYLNGCPVNAGFVIDEVIATVPPGWNGSVQKILDLAPLFLRWEQAALNMLRGSLTSCDDLLPMFWQVLCGGSMRKITEITYGDFPCVPEDVAAYNGLKEEFKAVIETGITKKIDGREMEYMQAMYATCTNRCFLVTSGGRIGIGPPNIQVKDKVGILYNYRVPIALREVDSMFGKVLVDKSTFNFIGECYVHGLMYGEALDEGCDPEADGFIVLQ